MQAAVRDAERQHKAAAEAAWEEAMAPKAVQAAAQLEGKSVSIEGCPQSVYNGVYRHHSTSRGWPVLKSAQGCYCYRYPPYGQWFLNTEFTPDEGNAFAAIVAKEGPLPVGAHTWQVWDGSKWEDCARVALGAVASPALFGGKRNAD